MLISKKNAQCFLYTGITAIAAAFGIYCEILSDIFLYTEGNGCSLNGKDITCEKAVLNQSITLVFVLYAIVICLNLYIRCRNSKV